MSQNCPKQEQWLELTSVPDEISKFKKWQLHRHAAKCTKCETTWKSIQSQWQSYFSPEPDVTASIMRVYGRLQKDETLILKGWKFGTPRPPTTAQRLMKDGWVFRGGITAMAASLVIFFAVTEFRSQDKGNQGMVSAASTAFPKPPLAQFRVEDKNSIKVHYVEPELLQSMEFETTSTR